MSNIKNIGNGVIFQTYISLLPTNLSTFLKYYTCALKNGKSLAKNCATPNSHILIVFSPLFRDRAYYITTSIIKLIVECGIVFFTFLQSILFI